MPRARSLQEQRALDLIRRLRPRSWRRNEKRRVMSYQFPEGTRETLTTASGQEATLHVREHEGEGPPVLFLHGYPTSGIDWRKIAPLFEGRRSLFPDLLGFGNSDKPKIRYSFGLHREFLETLLSRRGIREVDLVAHDYSATLAQELLLRQEEQSLPFRIRKTVLLNGGIYAEHHRARPIQKLLSKPIIGPFLAGRASRDTLANALRRIAGHPSYWTDAEIDEHFAAIAPRDGQRHLATMLHYIEDRRRDGRPWEKALEEVAARGEIHFVWGPEDPVSGGHVIMALRTRIDGVTITPIEGAGHYPHWEKPEETGRAVKAALDGGV